MNDILPNISVSDNGECLQLVGKINFSNAGSLYSRMCEMLTDQTEKIDCTGIDEADSTVLALLLTALNNSQQHEKPLKIVGLNAKLHSLADVYGISGLIQS